MSDTLRGHPIYQDSNGDWRFTDTGALTAETWVSRPCGYCGLYGNSNDGHADPCLGELAGVTNACCGHGSPADAYICFAGGLVVRGFEIDRLHQRHMSQDEQQAVQEHNEARVKFRELPRTI